MSTWLIVLVFAAAASSAQEDPAPQPTFKTGVVVVRVDVEVSTREGPVTDLMQSDFEILEDGKPMTIAHFELVKWRSPRSRTPRSEIRRSQPSSPDGPRTLAVPLPPTGGAYYVIGYDTLPDSTSGRFHRIEVRVKRRGVTVRAPDGYSPAPEVRR